MLLGPGTFKPCRPPSAETGYLETAAVSEVTGPSTFKLCHPRLPLCWGVTAYLTWG